MQIKRKRYQFVFVDINVKTLGVALLGNRGVRLFTLVLLFAFCIPAFSQQDPVLSIAEVLKDANSDTIPDTINKQVNVIGVVTAEPRTAGGTQLRINIQDATGGIMLGARRSAFEEKLKDVKRGDELMVRGLVEQLRGREMIEIQDVQILGKKPIPSPLRVTTADLNSEKYSGRLVEVHGELIMPPDFGTRNPDLLLRDESGEIALYFNYSYFVDIKFAEALYRKGKVKVIGLAGQIDGDMPYDGAYRLFPRDTRDFTFPWLPPWELIAYCSTGFAVGTIIFYLWARRRTAERREREITALWENLKKSDEALQKSESRLRLMIESMPAILWAVDEQMRFTSSLGAGLIGLGLKAGEVVGKTIYDYFGTRDPAFAPIGAHQQAFRGIPQTFDLNWRGRNFQAHIEPLRHADGTVVGCIGIALDTTEREQALAQFRQSQEMFRMISENVSDMIAVVDGDGRRLYNSPSYRAVLKDPGSVLGTESFQEVHPEDRSRVKHIFRETIRSGVNHRFECRFLLPDGTTRFVESETTYIPGKDVNAGRLILVSRDVSERKIIEAEREKLVAFPQFNPNPILELSAEGGINYSNAAAVRMAQAFGCEKPIELLPADFKQVVSECLRSGQKKLHCETTHIGRTVTWSFYPIEASRVVHCYADDITDRLYLEDQLRQSKKMESVGQLAAGVAHDFNNILTIIQGYSDLMLSRKNLPQNMAEPLHQISVAAERAANLTRQLLTFSRKQVMQSKSINLNDVINNVVTLLRRLLGADINLLCRLGKDVPFIHADINMMEQVIMNVAVNARDAMPHGGKLLIGTSFINVDEKYVAKRKEACVGEFVCLEITDSGEGMDPATLNRIFEPFFTTKEVGKGTGLGLATVYGIVKQHQGWIEVESARGQGTTFKIFFPALKENNHPPKELKDADFSRGNAETILVVEDEPGLRVLTKEILEGYGYAVLEAETGTQALPLWQQNRERIDLVLTDMVMPDGMSGRELVEEIRKVKPDQKVIYTSGYSMDVAGKNLSLLSGVNFLQKPYQPADLGKMVRACLDR